MNITNEGLAEICSLSNLENLNVGRNRLTDDGLEFIVQLRSLKRLCLHQTRVTDKAFRVLDELPELKHLWRLGSGATQEAAEMFVKEHPGIEVDFLQ